MNLTKKIARKIENTLSYTNGWKIPEAEYSAKCHKLAIDIVGLLDVPVKPAKTGQRKIKNIFNKIMSKKQLLPADNLPDYLRDAIMPKDVVEIAKKYGVELEYDE